MDEGGRDPSRIVHVFDLVGAMPPGRGLLADALPTGRFEQHLRAAADLLPQAVLDAEGVDLGIPGLKPVRILAVSNARRDGLLVIDGETAGDAQDIAAILARVCFAREELTADGVALAEWLSTRLGGAPVSLGRNVHQCVFAGGSLADHLLHSNDSRQERIDPATVTLVFRGSDLGTPQSIRWPAGLNSFGATLAAHGRGVGVFAGWATPFENGLVVATMLIVQALGVNQRVRRQAYAALEQDDNLAHVAALADHLNNLLLDLSFGVESHIDSAFLPEYRLDSYQSSLREAVGLGFALENTSRILQRLRQVIDARLASLEAHAFALRAEALERSSRRDKVIAVVVAVGSLIAIPPALLLAYFGVNGTDVDSGTSIFDMSRYWPAYVTAWAPFIILVGVGWAVARSARQRA